MHKCDCCDSESVVESMIDTFLETIKNGKNLLIPIVVPVLFCSKCEFEYTDHRAEDIKARAMKEALDS